MAAAGGFDFRSNAARADPHADFDGVGTGLGQEAKPLGCDDVAGDDRGVGALFEELDHLPLVLGVAVGGVDDEHIYFLRDEGFGSLAVLRVGGDGRADEQALLFVDGFVGVPQVLVEVLFEDHRLQDAPLG